MTWIWIRFHRLIHLYPPRISMRTRALLIIGHRTQQARTYHKWRSTRVIFHNHRPTISHYKLHRRSRMPVVTQHRNLRSPVSPHTHTALLIDNATRISLLEFQRHFPDHSCHQRFTRSHVHTLSNLSIHSRSIRVLSTKSATLAELDSTFVVLQRLLCQSTTKYGAAWQGFLLDVASRQRQHVRERLLPATAEALQTQRPKQRSD